MMDEFVIMNAEDYQEICNALRQVTNLDDTFTIGEILELTEDLSSSELEDDLMARTLTSISNEHITTIRPYCFHSAKLTTVHFPNVKTIGTYAFYNCDGLTEISLPSATSIADTGFRNCNNLNTLDCPVLKTVGNSTFRECIKLTTVNLSSATKISNYGFNKCSALVTLILRSSTLCSLTSTTAFTSTPIASGDGYIYVPSALIESYKTATNWTTYANQFRAIEDYPEICGG